MSKVLMILEVSGKQEYIFRSKSLKENVARSSCINYVIGDAFFRQHSDLYRKENNFVYSGGGHTVLQFENKHIATEFVKSITQRVLQDFPGLELIVKQLPYEDSLSPKENLSELSRQLELKKAFRSNTIRQYCFGIEETEAAPSLTLIEALQDQLPSAPSGFTYPSKFEILAGDDNYISVIHIDGNGMGNRVSKIYNLPEADNWDSCIELLDNFSKSIQKDYEDAFRSLCLKLSEISKSNLLPVRPIILAGDDMCIITSGNLGIFCADWILKELAKKNNPYDNLPYSACAGVAIVYKKLPFSQAYRLSEELCSNAKKSSAQLDKDKRVSAIDWHIEFAQLKGNLDKIREEYKTCDGDSLFLRPLASVIPEGCHCESLRTVDFFRSLFSILLAQNSALSRNMLKEFRGVLRQGEPESDFFLHDKQLKNLILDLLQAENNDTIIKESLHKMMEKKDNTTTLKAFCNIDNESKKRCLYFDVIDVMDHCVFP